MNNKTGQMIVAMTMVASALLMGFILGYFLFSPSSIEKANYNTLPYKIELIEAYNSYNKDCETLLDSIASKDNSFMDTTGETDTYCNYMKSREKLDSLINLEDCLY